MITLIIGENSFENTHTIKQLEAAFEGQSQHIDAETLTLSELPTLLMGMTLFADKRLIVIRNLSENKSLWAILPDWLERMSPDVHLVLVETKPDKRTKTFKSLQKVATVHESKPWTERDTIKAEQWVTQEAKKRGIELDTKSAQVLVARVGVDQWLLYHALEKLSVMDEINPTVIEKLIDAHPTENVFTLLETALKGNAAKVKQMVRVLQTTEEPYRLFALLSTQIFQLATLSVAEKPSASVATDIGAHPFVLSKLAPYAKKLDHTTLKKLVGAFAEADTALKTSAADPWLLIERALLKTVTSMS